MHYAERYCYSYNTATYSSIWKTKKQHKISYLNINYIYRMCKEHFIYVIKTEVTEMDLLANVHRSHIWEGNTNTSITQFPLPDDTGPERSQIHEENS